MLFSTAKDFSIGGCGGFGVYDFGVVCGFDVKDSPEEFRVDAVQSFEVLWGEAVYV